MTTRRDVQTAAAFRVQIRLTMSQSPKDEFLFSGPHSFDAAMALINMGLEMFLALGRDEPYALATAIAAVRRMPARFEEAARDKARPMLAALGGVRVL